MLPKYYRFHVMNNTGQTATKDDGAALSIRLSPWEFDVDGSLSYGTTITDNLGFDAAMTILDGASTEGDVQDNTVNKYLGLNGYFEAIHDLATASGQWDLYIESSDDNVNWPSEIGRAHV